MNDDDARLKVLAVLLAEFQKWVLMARAHGYYYDTHTGWVRQVGGRMYTIDPHVVRVYPDGRQQANWQYWLDDNGASMREAERLYVA